jgi:hypothetical protein
VESLTLKSTLYQNKESKHSEYNCKNEESRMRKTSNALTAIAIRIKLIQLAEAVDVADFTLPTLKGRGNPVVKWLSNQYRVFLCAEYPELKEGGKSWNTKLDDIKRRVRAGRRWQRLIKLFGVGIIGLVPSFAPENSRNHDFNKT